MGGAYPCACVHVQKSSTRGVRAIALHLMSSVVFSWLLVHRPNVFLVHPCWFCLISIVFVFEKHDHWQWRRGQRKQRTQAFLLQNHPVKLQSSSGILFSCSQKAMCLQNGHSEDRLTRFNQHIKANKKETEEHKSQSASACCVPLSNFDVKRLRTINPEVGQALLIGSMTFVFPPIPSEMKKAREAPPRSLSVPFPGLMDHRDSAGIPQSPLRPQKRCRGLYYWAHPRRMNASQFEFVALDNFSIDKVICENQLMLLSSLMLNRHGENWPVKSPRLLSITQPRLLAGTTNSFKFQRQFDTWLVKARCVTQKCRTLVFLNVK